MSTPKHPDPARRDHAPDGAWGEGPIASTPWSADFLAQTLELLIVLAAPEGIRVIRPIHAASVQVGWAPGRPADAVLADALQRYALTAKVLHSTSWRHVDDHVVLTYIAVVEAPAELNPNLTAEPARRAELARGHVTAAPAEIAVSQVLEHALRHLAWLVSDDPAVSAALPDWRPILAAYVPEPFRQL
jgi:hypothetical protein